MNTTDNSIEEIYKEHYTRSFLFVKSLVRSDEISKDIVSESMIYVWKKMNESQVDSPLGLLFITLKHNSLNYLKREQIKVKAMSNIQSYLLDDVNYRISSLEALDPTELLSNEIKELINETLAQLPNRTATVFKFSRFQNLSTKEIAQIFNITTKGVEYHMSVAMSHLRVALKDYLSILLILNI